MKGKVKKQLTSLQRDPERLQALKVAVRAVGVVWVAKTANISDQTVTNFINGREGTQRTESLIIQSLAPANERKLSYYVEEAKKTASYVDEYKKQLTVSDSTSVKCQL